MNREFDRDGPNQLWMTDITEHPTREGKLYCCAVLDAWSRRVVGWSIDRRPTAAMVNAALGMAVEQRRPPKGTLIHSDHGSSSGRGPSVNASGCVACVFTRDRRRRVRQRHSRIVLGSDADRAPERPEAEDAVELSSEIFDWIEVFYNRTRRHSSFAMSDRSHMRNER